MTKSLKFIPTPKEKEIPTGRHLLKDCDQPCSLVAHFTSNVFIKIISKEIKNALRERCAIKLHISMNQCHTHLHLKKRFKCQCAGFNVH